MQIDIITLFPGMFSGFLSESIIKRAQEKGIVHIRTVDLRDYTHDRHRTADDRPYGGGAGMVLKVEPLFEAVEALRTPESSVILLSPRGKLFEQERAHSLSLRKHLILLCGHYEGVDERFSRELVDEEISVGDYILTGGELPALVVVDSVVRLIPGVLGDSESSVDESFARGRLEYPQYTRPEKYRGLDVPKILLSGDHGKVARWREKESFLTTYHRRPDLLREFPPTEQEKKWLENNI
ncbi:MAG: tRNA (guanosine(37)-N1)-methyltransferase TrmD [Candidatus Auribacterota bacterium]|nr:tRNA (guanosine(37)-N1)-methyltransferase TrmD [Candidatus Auribacterota bacterium]